MDQIFLQHRFSIDRDGKHYSDAIVLPVDEYNKLSESDIENLKEERFTNWKNYIENPPKPIELKDLPKEDLEAQVVSIDEQISQLQAQKTQVSEAILVAKPKPIEEPVQEVIEEI